MEPATKRSLTPNLSPIGRGGFLLSSPAGRRAGDEGWLYSSASLLARRAAASLISIVRSARPYSPNVRRFERKVSVSSTSTPASRKERWTFSTASGYEMTR